MTDVEQDGGTLVCRIRKRLNMLDTTDRFFISCILVLYMLRIFGFSQSFPIIKEILGAALSILLGKKIMEFVFPMRQGRRG